MEETTENTQVEARRGALAILSGALLSIPVLGPLLLSLRTIVGPTAWDEPLEHPSLPIDEIPEKGVRQFRLSYERRAGAFIERVERIVFLRRKGDEVIALSADCTHLGCPVQYDEKQVKEETPEGVLACPCHGGIFDLEGRVLDGPPRGPLVRFAATVPGDRKKPVMLKALSKV